MRLYEFILLEAKAEALASKYEAKILTRASHDRSFGTNEVLPFLQQLESQFGKVVEWVLLKWLQGNFLIEDLPRVKAAITQFEQKKRGLEKKDINQYKTLLDLEDAIGLLDDVKSNRQKKQEIKSEGVNIIANNERILLVHLLTEEAAKFYGKNTKWCTSGDEHNQFANYNKAGPIYFLLDKGTNEKYQIHYQSTSCMDAFDEDYPYRLLVDIAPELNQIEPALEELQEDTDFEFAIYLTTFHDEVRWEREEPAISKNPEYAYLYARNSIKGRWPEGEAAISTDYYCAYEYASEAIEGRFPAGEAAIAANPEFAYRYAKFILKGRFPKGEVVIAQHPDRAYKYALEVIEGRFPAGEAAIASVHAYAYIYAKNVIEGRFPEGEATIANSPMNSFLYAKEVIKGRWPEAEDTIATDPQAALSYARDIIEGRWPKGEAAILTDSYYATRYAFNVINGRWPEAEDIIATSETEARHYNYKFGTNI